MDIRRKPVRARRITSKTLRLLVSDIEIQQHAEHVERKVAAQLAAERLARANRISIN